MRSVKIRKSHEQLSIVDQDAKVKHLSRSAFVREPAFRAACDVLPDRTIFQLSGEEFEAFERFLENPPPPNRALTDLLKQKAPWEID